MIPCLKAVLMELFLQFEFVSCRIELYSVENLSLKLVHILHCLIFIDITSVAFWLKIQPGLKTYHGEQNQGNHVKEPENLGQKQVSKVTLHFVWGHLSRKQTVSP